MKTSDSINKISVALLKAQRAITFASKDAKNPHFKNTYADLPAVIDAVKPALNEAGIVFLQSASPSDAGTLCLTTRLVHESGEWIEDTAAVPLPKNDPQGYGSAMTYARRYSLAAITGLYQDDDDGNGAMKPASRSGFDFADAKRSVQTAPSLNALKDVYTAHMKRATPEQQAELTDAKDLRKQQLTPTKEAA